MTLEQWIAVATIALPLVAKAASDYVANTHANHNAALVRVVGMAGRQAATMARTLADLPSGTSRVDVERALVKNGTDAILAEMAGSIATMKADPARVTAIQKAELDKWMVAPVVAKPGVT